MTTDRPTTVTEPPSPEAPRTRRPRWRLRILVAIAALSFGLHAFVRLDRSAAEWLGPVGEGVHDLFNQVPGKPPPLTPAGRRLVKDVAALGGDAGVNVVKRGVFGTIGQAEWANVTFHEPGFDDAALARLAEEHGPRIGGLALDNTGVTDAGLASLGKFTMLRHLQIRHFRRRRRDPVSPPKITDAGMVHLKGLDHLWTLDLGGLPITDSGLAAIEGLPELQVLFLAGTNVQGRRLSLLKSLPRLSHLQLEGVEPAEDLLKDLSGATSLESLSLVRVPLSADALPHLRAIPRLETLDLTGCGLLDEEVAELLKSKPRLRVRRW
jgi:hypothetical protein